MHERRNAGYEAASRCRILRADALSFEPVVPESFDIVHCYGLLYHTDDPACGRWRQSRANAAGLLLLETCVAFGSHEAINPVPERAHIPSQSVSGHGMPSDTSLAVQASVRAVRALRTCHDPAGARGFPLDWTRAQPTDRDARACSSRHGRGWTIRCCSTHVPYSKSRTDGQKLGLRFLGQGLEIEIVVVEIALDAGRFDHRPAGPRDGNVASPTRAW